MNRPVCAFLIVVANVGCSNADHSRQAPSATESTARFIRETQRGCGDPTNRAGVRWSLRNDEVLVSWDAAMLASDSRLVESTHCLVSAFGWITADLKTGLVHVPLENITHRRLHLID